MIIDQLRTNHIENPLGFMIENPVFSWVVEQSTGTKQKEAKIQIALDIDFNTIIYDSGYRQDLNSLGVTVDIKLHPCTRYYWNVEVFADNGDQGISEIAWFETGKMEKAWLGKWITTNETSTSHPVFVKRFAIDKKIKSARAYVIGLGLYELKINGHKIGDEYLTPFFNDYNHWIQYQTYDITAALKDGENIVGSIVGNGWYKGRFGFIDKLDQLYGNEFKFLCDLVIEFLDGSQMIIGTDESWHWHESSILKSSIYDGEVIDATRLAIDWSKKMLPNTELLPVIYADKPEAKITERLSPEVKIIEKVKPIQLLNTPAGEKVIDFGQVLTGWVEFEVNMQKGEQIKLQYGELLQEDNFYNENLRTAKQEFIYISNGEKEVVRPHFTFYGFRYVKVTGIKDLSLEDFVGCVIHSDLKRTGNIETSNKKVNKLFRNALWGQKGNFLDVPTDCPQRDERMGWTGDAQVFAATASFNMYTPAFYTKYLYDMYLEQEQLNGSVAHVVPDVLSQIMKITKQEQNVQHGSCAWGDAATIIPWTLYLFYGDKSLLQTQYKNMRKWVDFIKNQEEKYCEGKRLWQHGFHFADWLALDNPDPNSSFGGTDPYFVASAYYYYSARLTAKAAKVLGKKDEADEYQKLSDEIKEAFQKEYFTSDGKVTIETQTAMIMALYMDIVPEEYKKSVTKDLVKKLQSNNMYLDTGFVGTPYLCPVLSENGYVEHAYSLLLNEEYPGWLYEVNMGATTVWERWNSVLPNGLVSDTGMNSMNHYAYGSVVEWMYRYMGGINPVEEKPGFKKVIIRPQIDSRFTWIKTKYDSPSGRYKSEWEIKSDKTIYKIEVPFDCEADFIAPKDIKQLFVNEKEIENLNASSILHLTAGEYEIHVLN